MRLSPSLARTSGPRCRPGEPFVEGDELRIESSSQPQIRGVIDGEPFSPGQRHDLPKTDLQLVHVHPVHEGQRSEQGATARRLPLDLLQADAANLVPEERRGRELALTKRAGDLVGSGFIEWVH